MNLNTSLDLHLAAPLTKVDDFAASTVRDVVDFRRTVSLTKQDRGPIRRTSSGATSAPSPPASCALEARLQPRPRLQP